MLGWAIVALVFALPLRGLLRTQGPPMEEGFMLTFPERVLHGDIPNRDFLHLYGPGSLWALAGVFKVFGVSLWSERLFGLVQQLAIVAGVYLIARRWGRVIAVSAGTISALVIIPFGLTALAWVGAVGLAMCGLALALHAREQPDASRARHRSLLAGVLLGLALLFRPDLIVAVTLATIVLVRGQPLERAQETKPEPTGGKAKARVDQSRALLGGIAIGVSPYIIHLATAGPGHAFKGMVLDPIFRLRGGRSLPLPPPWGHLDGFLQRAGALAQISWPIPAFKRSSQLCLWFFLLLAAAVFVAYAGIKAVRADRDSPSARALLVAGLFGLGIIPQAVQRVDSAHLQWVGCVPIAFVPVAVFDLVRRRTTRLTGRNLALACGATTLAVIVFALPAFSVRVYADYALQTFDIHRTAFKIEHKGRVFYYGKPDRAHAAQMVIDAAAKLAHPGARLFVGPANLRKTPYSDAYLYYMLPEFRPGTYYIEMDPGVANANDSGL
ncbi:MAG TPA: glycosyltransferase family 39 protein, partial [Acidimicrobiia bacterium]|nr:glycosyltransferase family 39 protein [Acidimicrobiia bacterium]